MPRYGIHAMVWVGGWSREEAERAVGSAAKFGYDLIEIPLFDPAAADLPHTRDLLKRHGLSASVSLGLTPETDVSSPDAKVSASGAAHLARIVDAAAELGADTVAGVIASAWMKYTRAASPQGYANAVSAIREVASGAQEKGVGLAVEVVNRFESNLLNTAADAMRFVERVGAPNVTVHLDTFHMHIEEADLAAAIAVCGDRLGYFHVNESHRGYLGTGTIPFRSVFRALANAGYDGVIAFEAFSSAVTSPEVAGLAAAWRDVFSDSDDLAAHAIAYMRREVEDATRARALAGLA